MKKIKSEYIVSGLFVFIIMFFMCAVFFRFFGAKYLHIDFEKTDSAETGEITAQTAGTDWTALYPFDGKYTFNYEKNAETAQPETKEWGFKDTVGVVESRIDYYTSNLLFGRMEFVEANALFNKAVGMKIISGTDSVVVMNNGYLTFQAYEVDTEYAAESLKWFNDTLNEKGINFMYVQFPSKENPFDNRLPVGIEDYNNINSDSLKEKLSESNVDYTDFRPLLNSASDNWYGSFFRTDHHWLPETGVWAAGELAKLLNGKCGYDIDENIGKPENYNIKVYEDYCLGSQGRVSTLKYTDPEDISLITPKSKTDFTVKYNSEEPKTGSFEDVMIDMSAFAEIDYYNISTYSAYLYGNTAVTSIKNNSCHNGKRLLLLSDSFCKCVVPFLAQEIEYLDILDRRYFTGSVMSYIKRFSPDTVIVACNPTMISADTSHSGMFNFE